MASFQHSTDQSPQGGRQKRYFTLADANRSLVLVKRIVADVVTEYSRLLDLQELADAAQANEDCQRAENAHAELAATAEKLRCCLEELDDMGVLLTDWSVGMVDFPSLVNGREVQLSWRCGEPQVCYWRDTHSGSKGRQPIETLLTDPALTIGGR